MASLGFLHTILGPDHYLPFIVLSKARKWSITHTVWITLICGIGHVGSSIILGTVGIALGLGIHKVQSMESVRGHYSSWALLIFGLIYMTWGLWKV